MSQVSTKNRNKENGHVQGQIVTLYYPDDHPEMPRWFKDMKAILQECGLYPPGGMNAMCEGFKCPLGHSDCCYHRTLFNQPDFITQKSHLQEFIESCGHICDFYLKYHPELNLIEQYWGTAKALYRSTCKTSTIAEMEANVQQCLNDVPLLKIQWCMLTFYKLTGLLTLSLDLPTILLSTAIHTYRVYMAQRASGLIIVITAITHYLLSGA